MSDCCTFDTDVPDDLSQDPKSGPPPACCATDVAIPDDLKYGDLFYPTQGYSFVLDCPPGYDCFGQFTITIPVDRIPPVLVPQNPTLLSLQGCISLITATVAPGATLAQIQAIVQSMQQQWAQQQALCDLQSKLPPLPTYRTLPSPCIDSQYQQTITPFGSGSWTFTIGSGSLPPGLVIFPISATSLRIIGTPTVPGSYYFAVVGKNRKGTKTAYYTINVLGITNAADIPNGQVGVAYSFQLLTAGGASVTFSIVGGALPDGLTMAPDGTISGTPTTQGDFTFTVQMVDSRGNNCLATQAILVQPAAGWTDYWTLDSLSAQSTTKVPPTSTSQDAVGMFLGKTWNWYISQGMSTTPVAGKINNGGDLTCTYDGFFAQAFAQLYSPDTPDYANTGQPFTISMWLNFSTWTNSYLNWFMNFPPSYYIEFWVDNPNQPVDALAVTVGYDSPSHPENPAGQTKIGHLSAGWNFVTVTWDPTTNTMAFYANAVLMGSITLIESMPLSASASWGIFVGLPFDGSASTVSLIIDEVGFFQGQKLTLAQIQELYNAGAGRRPPL